MTFQIQNSAHQHIQTGLEHLGNEPPLLTSSEGDRKHYQRQVSFRWLAGTMLIGVTSVILMGGALLSALDEWNSFTPPNRNNSEFRLRQLTREVDIVRTLKGDMIEPVELGISYKQNIEIPVVRTVGNRQIVRPAPYILISSPMDTRRDDHIAKIPKFDPLSIFDSVKETGSDDVTQQVYVANLDGEIEIGIETIPEDLRYFDYVPKVHETVLAKALLDEKDRYDKDRVIALPFAVSSMIEDSNQKSFSTQTPLSVKITTENVSGLVKSIDIVDQQGYQEDLVIILPGDSLSSILSNYGVNNNHIGQISDLFRRIGGVEQLKDSQILRIAYLQNGTVVTDRGIEHQSPPVRISLYESDQHQTSVGLAENGKYIAVAKPSRSLSSLSKGIDINEGRRMNGRVLSVYESLYQTSANLEVDEMLIKQLIQVFAFDVNYTQRSKLGDHLSLFYSVGERESPDRSGNELLFASIKIGGVEKKFYRFRSKDDGRVDFYDETGKSSKQFLLRKPVAAGRFTSGYGYRRHPVLGYRKLHTGVDWAAPRGTPIMAAGNGVIETYKWNTSYGRYAKLTHTNGYQTAYAHMSKFVKGLRAGSRVRQGQVIGYVGSSGRSTGNHLHYEVYVNSRRVNPLKIRLPKGRTLKGDSIRQFKENIELIEQWVQKAESSRQNYAEIR